MDAIKIGERSLAIARPTDLDQKLVATTGCSSAEHVAMLRHVATPYGVARALWPMLGDPGDLTVAALAEAIADDDVGMVAAQAVALLGPRDAAAPAGAGEVILG